MDLNRFKIYLKTLVEEIKPDLRSYMQLPIKAKVVACHYGANNYTVDLQPLKHDLSVDETRPIIKEVPLSTGWGSSSSPKGRFCLPRTGAIVRIGFYDGDPNDPYIDDTIAGKSPALEEGELLILEDKIGLGDENLVALDGVITMQSIDPFTGVKHIDGSVVVLAKK